MFDYCLIFLDFHAPFTLQNIKTNFFLIKKKIPFNFSQTHKMTAFVKLGKNNPKLNFPYFSPNIIKNLLEYSIVHTILKIMRNYNILHHKRNSLVKCLSVCFSWLPTPLHSFRPSLNLNWLLWQDDNNAVWCRCPLGQTELNN